MKRPDLALRNTTHGLSKKHPSEYKSWKDMRMRCRNPNNKDYKDYGARGISVSPAWEDFAVFFSDMGSKPRGYTLDRIDVDANYSNSNCRWADSNTQQNNKRNNHIIEWNGIRKNLLQWCKEIGIEQSKVRYRLKQGWPLDKAFSHTDYRL